MEIQKIDENPKLNKNLKWMEIQKIDENPKNG